MASATPDLRLPSQLALIPNLYCPVTVEECRLKKSITPTQQ